MRNDEIGNATVRVPGSAHVAATSDDVATRAWQRSVDVPREALLATARSKVDRLMALPIGWDGYGAGPVPPLAAMTLNGLLERLVRDDGATPQITPLAEGGIQVEWLAGGDSLQISVFADGDIVIEGEDGAGNVLVDGQMATWNRDDFLLDQAGQWLAKIGHRVSQRLPVA